MTQEKPMPSDERLYDDAMKSVTQEDLNRADDALRAVDAFPYSIDRLTWPRTMIDQHEARIDGERRAFVKGLQAARQSDLAKIEALTKLAQELVDGVQTMKQGSFADSFLFADDADLDRFAEALVASAALLSITPTPEP